MTDVEMTFSYDGWNITFTQQLRNDIDSMPDQPIRKVDVLKKFLNIIEKQSHEIQQLKDKSEFENRNVDNQDEVHGKSEREWLDSRTILERSASHKHVYQLRPIK